MTSEELELFLSREPSDEDKKHVEAFLTALATCDLGLAIQVRQILRNCAERFERIADGEAPLEDAASAALQAGSLCVLVGEVLAERSVN